MESANETYLSGTLFFMKLKRANARTKTRPTMSAISPVFSDATDSSRSSSSSSASSSSSENAGSSAPGSPAGCCAQAGAAARSPSIKTAASLTVSTPAAP